MTGRSPPNKTHITVLDGTASSLEPGHETNAGLLCKLLKEGGVKAGQTLYYEPGIQWADWWSTGHVMTGMGTNRLIRRAYGALASRYRPGDRIMLFGYSRGAYAVRSMAGIIDRVGLLKQTSARPRMVREVYRHYQRSPDSEAAKAFARAHCHEKVEIELVAVWDTVKALGNRLPVFWRFSEPKYAFHNHDLGLSIRHGYHALAMDETRMAYAPVLWTCHDEFEGRIEQVWFKGSHGDVGGQLRGFDAARPLANIPLVWLLEKAEGCGIVLPDNWRDRFPQDAAAPPVGSWRGWGKFFLSREKRVIGADPSESIHPTVGDVPLVAEARA